MASTVFGVLPAAGRGRRVAGLRWLKQLYPVGWDETTVDGTRVRRPRPVAAYQIDGMIEAGAAGIFVVVGENADLMHHFGGFRRRVPLAYFYQDELRGGAFAIDLARPWLPPDHTVLFGFPDTIVEPADAFAQLLVTHRLKAADLTLGLFPTDRPEQFGMVRLEGDRPVELVDKPRRTDLRLMYGLACWGPRFTALQPAVLARAQPDRELVPGDLFEAAIRAGLVVRAHLFEGGRYLDVGTPAGLNDALTRYGTATF